MAVAHDDMEGAGPYFRQRNLPFPGLVDPEHALFDLYGVESRFSSLGQRPAVFIVDTDGMVRYAYRGTQQWQIPTNRELLEELDKINETPLSLE